MRHLALLPLLAACQLTDAETPTRPNILLIMADDQGYGDFGCTGNPVLQTPHIDSLARDGTMLTRFYVNPVCSPTRASLMTGRYSHRTRVVDTWRGRSMMEPEETTIAELLQAEGYHTGIFGKWHLGDCYPMRPQDQGFVESLVHRGGGIAQPSEPVANGRRYTDPILLRNGEEVQTSGYCMDVYTDAALASIRRSARRQQPFFCYLATNTPHGPFHDVPQDLYEKYQGMDLGQVVQGGAKAQDRLARIFAMIENIDQNVGRLLRCLAELDLERETIVIYLSDNGPAGKRYVGPMRGQKGEVLEGGIRTPFLLRWPGRVPAGRSVAVPCAHIDVLPTLCAWSGTPIPSDLDGADISDLCTGATDSLPHRLIHIQSHRGDRPVPGHNFAVIGPRYKLCRTSGFGRESPSGDPPLQLYDLQQDPHEGRNLQSQAPGRAEALFQAHLEWSAEVAGTRPDNFAPPRIVVGHPAEPQTLLTMQDWRAEGSGWGTRGGWWIRVEEPGPFRVELLFAKPTPLDGSSIQLRGNQMYATDVQASSDSSYRFRLPDLPRGDHELHVISGYQGQDVRPYQVLLRRLPR